MEVVDYEDEVAVNVLVHPVDEPPRNATPMSDVRWLVLCLLFRIGEQSKTVSDSTCDVAEERIGVTVALVDGVPGDRQLSVLGKVGEE